jgi:hypothetical protein
MPDSAALAFLVEPIGRGMTVLVLGAPDPELRTALCAAIGPVGLICAVSPHLPTSASHEGRGCDATRVRGLWTRVPVRSHVADLVVLTGAAADEEPDVVVEEVRRLLAPGGVVRAIAPVDAAYRLVGELHAAAFRNAELLHVGAAAGVRAGGPR